MASWPISNQTKGRRDLTSSNRAFVFSTMGRWRPYRSDLGRPFFSNLKEAAAWVNAAVNGAGQEADAIGAGLGKVVERPELVARAAQEAWPMLRDNPRLWPYLGGRLVMGALTRLGPAAMAGDALRAVEKGHNLADAFFYHGMLGNPSKDPR